MLEEQFIHAPDVVLGQPSFERHDGVVQCVVALLGCHVLQPEVPGMDGGQNTRQDQLRIQLSTQDPNAFNQPVQIRLHARKARPREFERVKVDFQIESGELIDYPRIIGQGEDFLSQRGRLGIAIDQKELLLGAYTLDIRLEHVILKHVLESAHVLHDVACKTANLRCVFTPRDVLDTHVLNGAAAKLTRQHRSVFFHVRGSVTT